MLVPNRSFLNREYDLKTLASIISICNLHVTFCQRLHRDILRYLQMQYFVH
jgi:hypothetical protein